MPLTPFCSDVEKFEEKSLKKNWSCVSVVKPLLLLSIIPHFPKRLVFQLQFEEARWKSMMKRLSGAKFIESF